MKIEGLNYLTEMDCIYVENIYNNVVNKLGKERIFPLEYNNIEVFEFQTDILLQYIEEILDNNVLKNIEFVNRNIKSFDDAIKLQDTIFSALQDNIIFHYAK